MLISNTIAFKAVQLSENKVFITYIKKVSSSYYLKAVTCSIQDNMINLDNNVTQILQTVNNASVYLIKLKENKVIIINRISNKYTFYICTISDNNIICNTDSGHTAEVTTNYSTPSQFIALSEDKFVMLYASSINYSYPISLIGKVGIINSNNEITFGENVESTTTDLGRYFSAIKVSENKILITSNTEVDSYIGSISITPCIINENSLAFREFNTTCIFK